MAKECVSKKSVNKKDREKLEKKLEKKLGNLEKLRRKLEKELFLLYKYEIARYFVRPKKMKILKANTKIKL
jgi:hypothetical protein